MNDKLFDDLGEMTNGEVEDDVYCHALRNGSMGVAREAGQELYERVCHEYSAQIEQRDKISVLANVPLSWITDNLMLIRELYEILEELAGKGRELAYADTNNEREGI